jgi:hypothetical protein
MTLLTRTWNDTEISRRESDDYVNATAMCKANGREWFTYSRSSRAQEYMAALAGVTADLRSPADLVQTITTGPNELRGTWVHPRLAVDLARWISPAFAVWMDGWLLEGLVGNKVTSPDPIHATLDILERLDRIQCLSDADRDRILDQVIPGRAGVKPAGRKYKAGEMWFMVTGKKPTGSITGKLGQFISGEWRKEFGTEPDCIHYMHQQHMTRAFVYEEGWLRGKIERLAKTVWV